MAVVAAAIPIKVAYFKSSKPASANSNPSRFAPVKRQSSVMLVALNKSSFKVMYTKPFSSILNRQGLKVVSTKPLLITYLLKNTGTATGGAETYGKTGQVYPTGFN